MKPITVFFDNLKVNNLFEAIGNDNIVSNDVSVLSSQFKKHGFELKEINNEHEKGIYNISVGAAPSWYQITSSTPHVLYYLSIDIKKLVRKKTLKIFLNSQAEGWPLSTDGIDGYRRLHDVLKKLNFPAGSVIFGDSNLKFEQDYHNWCCENLELPLIKHCYFLTGFYYFDNRIPERPLYLDAIENNNSKDFNSLNRNTRRHRLEHLYYLVSRNLHNIGIVSGNLPTNYHIPPIFNKVSLEEFKSVLEPVSPLIADGPWYELNPDSDDTAIFNHDIYKNSLLSVVTESAYYSAGMFITEKVFKPIVAGHPFMVLGQPGILKTLRQMGYRTDFHGIDQRYDDIEDPIARFNMFHFNLEKWCRLSREQKIVSLIKSKDAIEHNFNLYKTKDYVKQSYENLKWAYINQ